MSDDFLLPHETFDAVGVPDGMRDEVAYKVLCAKYCALVEAVLRITGGEPVRVSWQRVKEIAAMDQRTDPRLTVMVAEVPVGDDEHMDVRLATVGEIQEANRRYALSRMGSRRN